MWLVINFVGALLVTSPASADLCVFSLMPAYALKSDAVNWELQIASGKTCTKGLKYGSVPISNVKLNSPAGVRQGHCAGTRIFIYGKTRFRGAGRLHHSSHGHDGQDDGNIRYSGHRLGCKIDSSSSHSARP